MFKNNTLLSSDAVCDLFKREVGPQNNPLFFGTKYCALITGSSEKEDFRSLWYLSELDHAVVVVSRTTM